MIDKLKLILEIYSHLSFCNLKEIPSLEKKFNIEIKYGFNPFYCDVYMNDKKILFFYPEHHSYEDSSEISIFTDGTQIITYNKDENTHNKTKIINKNKLTTFSNLLDKDEYFNITVDNNLPISYEDFHEMKVLLQSIEHQVLIHI